MNSSNSNSRKRSHSDAAESSTTEIPEGSTSSNPMNDLLARSYPNGVVHHESTPPILRSEALELELGAIPLGTDSDEEASKDKTKKRRYFDERLPSNRYAFMNSQEILETDLSEDESDAPFNPQSKYPLLTNDEDNTSFALTS